MKQKPQDDAIQFAPRPGHLGDPSRYQCQVVGPVDGGRVCVVECINGAFAAVFIPNSTAPVATPESAPLAAPIAAPAPAVAPVPSSPWRAVLLAAGVAVGSAAGALGGHALSTAGASAAPTAQSAITSPDAGHP